MKLKPLGDRVLVEVLEKESKTDSGIIIPDVAKDENLVGKVIEVGTGEDIRDLVEVGEEVLFSRFSGDSIMLGGKEYRLLVLPSIFGIVE